jgi:hypothetical protein
MNPPFSGLLRNPTGASSLATKARPLALRENHIKLHPQKSPLTVTGSVGFLLRL